MTAGDGKAEDGRDLDMLAYALQLQAAVDDAAHDDDLVARVRGFEGGSGHLLRFLAEGMALAFDPERAAGETGLVQFAIADDACPIDLWLQIDADACRSVEQAGEPDTVIGLPLPVFLRIAFKQISGADAYMDGLVHASGDVVLAATLDDWFDPPNLAMARATR